MEYRHINQITPYNRNPRKNEKAIERVLESLKIHSQVKPLVISEKGYPFEQEVVCCGHTTLEALKRFGAEEVRVVVQRFQNESEFVDLLARDNKSGEFAEWDDVELMKLAIDFDVDFQEMGFDMPEDFGDSADPDEFPPENKKYEIVVECSDGEEREQIYNKLLQTGLKCRKS